jgi:hypothetical protein
MPTANLSKSVEVWYGICFRNDKESEVDNILGMQSMTATVASLLAGLAAGESKAFTKPVQ